MYNSSSWVSKKRHKNKQFLMVLLHKKLHTQQKEFLRRLQQTLWCLQRLRLPKPSHRFCLRPSMRRRSEAWDTATLQFDCLPIWLARGSKVVPEPSALIVPIGNPYSVGHCEGPPGPSKYIESWPFGLSFEVSGHSFTYFWGPGSTVCPAFSVSHESLDGVPKNPCTSRYIRSLVPKPIQYPVWISEPGPLL